MIRRYRAGADYRLVRSLADGARGGDPKGYRAAFVGLVRQAEKLGNAAVVVRP